MAEAPISVGASAVFRGEKGERHGKYDFHFRLGFRD